MPVPSAPILAYEQDEDGAWVATLACGHTRHLRHNPPWQFLPFVLTVEGRRAHLGVELSCSKCRMPVLPGSVRVHERTAVFDQGDTPPKLLCSHRLPAGSWGRIRVLQGKLLYTLQGAQELSFMLAPRFDGVVEPATLHHVSLRGAVRFQMELLR